MSPRELFLRHVAQTSPFPLALEIERAEGIYLYDRTGKAYLDLIAGIGPSVLGHRFPAVQAAVEAQLHRYWHLVGHGSYTFGQNLSAHEPLRRIPPFNGRLQLSFVLKGRWEYRLETLFATEQNRLAAADKADNRINPNGTPGWQIVNLGLWYRFKQVSVAAELHNLFNEAYRTLYEA